MSSLSSILIYLLLAFLFKPLISMSLCLPILLYWNHKVNVPIKSKAKVGLNKKLLCFAAVPIAFGNLFMGAVLPNNFNDVIQSSVMLTMAALCEELIFRGIILREMEVKSINHSIIYSSLVFGVFHLFNSGSSFYVILFQSMTAFILGILFAFLTVNTGSIALSFAVHALINVTSLFVSPEINSSASFGYLWTVLMIYSLIYSFSIKHFMDKNVSH